MMYNTRQELADAVIKEYNRAVKSSAFFIQIFN